MVEQVRTTPNVRQSLDLLKFELVHRKKYCYPQTMTNFKMFFLSMLYKVRHKPSHSCELHIVVIIFWIYAFLNHYADRLRLRFQLLHIPTFVRKRTQSSPNRGGVLLKTFEDNKYFFIVPIVRLLWKNCFFIRGFRRMLDLNRPTGLLHL